MTVSTLPSPGAVTPQPLDGIASGAQAFPTRIRKSRIGLWMALVVVTAGVFGGAAWAVSSWWATAVQLSRADQYTVAPRSFAVVLKEKGELKAAISTEITCEVQGRSTIINLVPEGKTVKAGDLLVELASDQIEDRIRQEELKEANAITAYESAKTELEIRRDKNASDIRKSNLDIELKKLALKKYEEGDWTQRLKDADIEIQQARINLQRRREDYEASQQLVDRKFITKTEFDESDFNFKRAAWDLEKAQKAKEVLEKYTHVADLRRRESDVEEALKEHDRVVKNAGAEEVKKTRAVEGKKKELDLTQDELAKQRRQREKCRLTAPTDGIVVYYSGGGRHFMSDDSQIRKGATVYERQVLLTLPDTKEMQVVVRVHEAKTDKLRLGQAVRVRVEGMPDRVFTGTVTKIAAVADTQNRWLNPDLKEYETEISLEPTDVPLKPGVTAYAEIMVTRIEHKLAAPVQSVFTKAGRRFVFVAKDRGEITPVEVQVGAIGTEWAEITKGLTGGEQILLAFGEEQQRLVPDLLPPAGGGRAGTQRRSPAPKTGRHRPNRRPGASSASSRPATASAGRSGSGGSHRAAPTPHAKPTAP